jgi:hypothetical protein
MGVAKMVVPDGFVREKGESAFSDGGQGIISLMEIKYQFFRRPMTT